MKKAEESSAKMTGSPRRHRHLMSVGPVVCKIVDTRVKTYLAKDTPMYLSNKFQKFPTMFMYKKTKGEKMERTKKKIR